MAGESGGFNRYHWADLLEVGWAGSALPLNFGCRPIVRPKGEPFAVPGPNHPQAIGTLAIFGRTRDDGRRTLQEFCERHGVPFSDRDVMILQDPPPGSPFRR